MVLADECLRGFAGEWDSDNATSTTIQKHITMTEALKTVLEKGDHWSLGILLFAILILGLFKLPIFKELSKTHGYSILLNLLWVIAGISALYILVVLIRDISRDSKEVELARIQASIKTIEENANLIREDSTLKDRYKKASQLIIPVLPFQEPRHPIEIDTIDHSRCWIKIQAYSHISLLRRPNWKSDQVISTSIPGGIYYVLAKQREPQFNQLFFKIKLTNGLVGWVKDLDLNKNPKCYD